MKKVNFTLVLTLAMLFMAANVSAGINHSFTLKGGWSYLTYVGWGSANLDKGLYNFSNGTLAERGWAAIAGNNDLEGKLNSTIAPITIYNLKEGESATYDAASQADITAFYNDDPAYDAGLTRYNFFQVNLKYKNGNELRPVLKRTIRMGALVEIDFLPVYTSFRPNMEHNTDVAQFIFIQNATELREKWGIRPGSDDFNVQIDYELTINDELNYQGSKFHVFQPPVWIGPSGPVGGNSLFFIECEDGLLTEEDFCLPVGELAFNDNGGWTVFYMCPAGSKLIFEVALEAGKVLSVATNCDNDKNGDRGFAKIDRTKIEDGIEYNYWKVTVNNITSQMVITLSTSETKSEDATGNPAIAADAVWSAGGTLYANAANPGVLTVYSITGQLIKTINISGNFTLPLDRGIYVVQLNGKAYKVVL